MATKKERIESLEAQVEHLHRMISFMLHSLIVTEDVLDSVGDVVADRRTASAWTIERIQEIGEEWSDRTEEILVAFDNDLRIHRGDPV